MTRGEKMRERKKILWKKKKTPECEEKKSNETYRTAQLRLNKNKNQKFSIDSQRWTNILQIATDSNEKRLQTQRGIRDQLSASPTWIIAFSGYATGDHRHADANAVLEILETRKCILEFKKRLPCVRHKDIASA
ncbi:hypothetical protein PUN28_019987 [Cardiocondyla obscurior]|uniref:Uncharacterized protein n=1 Tax=Cardiocondyla obscurior TaxID=286306 RepID=A0AAW2EDS0_9HYME